MLKSSCQNSKFVRLIVSSVHFVMMKMPLSRYSMPACVLTEGMTSLGWILWKSDSSLTKQH